MNIDISDTVIPKLKEFYQRDRNARRFLDKAASRQRDASATSVERIMALCEIDRAEAVKLAKNFQDIGCADFVVGRRGSPSRLEWKFSLISLGRTAAGEIDELQSVSDNAELDEGAEGTIGLELNSDTALKPLSIADAKEGLARSLGISASNIEISIKA